jgi:CheY-like chemotaxis protein
MMKLYERPDLWWDLIHEEDQKKLQPFFKFKNQSDVDPSYSSEQTYRICRPDGSVRYIKETRFQLSDEYNNCIAIGVIARDVTGLKQWEASLKSAVTSKEEMRSYEHNYWNFNRQLMNIHFNEVSNLLLQLSSRSMEPTLRSDISRVHEHTLQMHQLFNDMLAYMQIDCDELNTTTIAPFNLLHAIDGLQDFFSSTFALQGLRFVVNVDTKLDFEFVGDVESLKQALRSLVLFVLQEHDAKVIFLQAQALERTGSSLVCQFSVSCIGDYSHHGETLPSLGKSGRGSMDGEQTFHYNPHYRLAAGILKKLGTQLQVQHNDQHGLQITTKLEFVFQQTQFKSTNQVTSVQDNILYYGRKITNKALAHVLIVEDNVINQHVVSLILKEIGCTSDIANNAAEALTLWDREYDIVFLDIGLPGMDGFELAHQLRMNKKKMDVPIIGMSAHICVTEHDRDSLGPLDDFINKPFGLANVNSLIKKWVTDREKKRAIAQEL